MKYPVMNGENTYRVEVPQLSGGVNLAEPASVIEDMQLADANNVWWKKGALRTREGLKKIASFTTSTYSFLLKGNAISERESVVYRTVKSGDTFILTPYRVTLGAPYAVQIATRGDGSFTVSEVNGDVPSILAVKAETGGSAGYYFYCSSGDIFRTATSTDSGDASFVEVEPYAPLVLVNGKGNMDESKSPGVMYEGYNRIGSKFRAWYVPDGKSTTFALPTKNLDAVDATVEIDLFNTKTQEMRTLTLTVPAASSTAAEYGYASFTPLSSEIGVTNSAHIQGTVHFFADKGEIQIKCDVAIGDSREVVALPNVAGKNAIRVTCSRSDAEMKKSICQMTRAVWFGGDRSGLGGGTRLFLSGNPDKKNIVCWSDINNPLFFPESCYAYIGSSDSSVTAFGKQTDLLIVFKEHEVYAMQYVAGKSYTVDDVTSGRVTDVTALAATFPITPLHPTIGCDCPNSVRLVNNRLVWITSDRHVYMMPSVNQWSERNVRDITARIRPTLENHTAGQLQRARSGEYRGYYFFVVEDTVYLLDVGNSAFQSYQYYSSETKASRMLPWYIWHLPQELSLLAVLSDNESVTLTAGDIDGNMAVYTFEGDTDDGADIPAYFVTKGYTFGREDEKKRIPRLSVTVENTEAGAICVSYLTESGTYVDPHIIRTEGGTEAMQQAAHIRTVPLMPHINRCRSFGMRFESEKTMAIQGIAIQYTLQGGIK